MALVLCGKGCRMVPLKLSQLSLIDIDSIKHTSINCSISQYDITAPFIHNQGEPLPDNSTDPVQRPFILDSSGDMIKSVGFIITTLLSPAMQPMWRTTNSCSNLMKTQAFTVTIWVMFMLCGITFEIMVIPSTALHQGPLVNVCVAIILFPNPCSLPLP